MRRLGAERRCSQEQETNGQLLAKRFLTMCSLRDFKLWIVDMPKHCHARADRRIDSNEYTLSRLRCTHSSIGRVAILTTDRHEISREGA